MQLAVVVGVCILLCLRRTAVDSSNLTMTLAADRRAQSESAGGIKLKHKHKQKTISADKAPSMDVAAEVSEGSKVYDKWETGNLIVIETDIMSILCSLYSTIVQRFCFARVP